MKLFSSLGRIKQEFSPISETVTMYSCGPTVYDYAHIGNLRSYIFPDVLKKLLILLGHEVKHVINITDVGHLTSDSDTGDDKIEKSAKGSNAWELSKYYAEAFKRDLQDLNIDLPTKFTYATNYIDEQIELIKTLEAKGYTYITEDGVYFDISKKENYDCLSNLKLDDQQASTRSSTGKRNSQDFALWKFSQEPRQMEWSSPWGVGFPGWHIECSAMVFSELGTHIDIHTGGTDHIPVHHTNEIAQSEACTGHKFVNYWLHGEFLVVDNAKMGKSYNNFITLSNLKEKYRPLAFRYLAINSHYRSFLNYSDEAMISAEKSLKKLWSCVYNLGYEESGIYFEYDTLIEASLCDDLNTAKALGHIWTMLKDPDMCDGDKRFILAKYNPVFGIDFFQKVPSVILEYANMRHTYRLKKMYDKSDIYREVIKNLGFIIKDTKEGFNLEWI